MPGQNDEMKNAGIDCGVQMIETNQAPQPTSSTGVKLGKLHKITVTQEMFLTSKTFSLGRKKYKDRDLAVVKTTVENLQKYNGAWIFAVGGNIVTFCDNFEVRKNLEDEFKNLEDEVKNLEDEVKEHNQVTLEVYFSERPRSYFEETPRQVGVSITLINMSAIDTMKQTFQARFLMKTIWEPSPKEVEIFNAKGYHSTGSGWRPRFLFPNCTEVERRNRFKWPMKAKEDGKNKEPFILSKYLLLKDGDEDPYGSPLKMLPEYIMYGELEFHGTFAELLELEAFPFDCQDFSIICWSNGILKDQQMVPFDLFLGACNEGDDDHNPQGFCRLPLLQVNLSSSNVTSEWDIKNIHVSLENTRRSNMYIIIKARRRYNLYLWRIFIPVYLLVVGCQVCFLLSPSVYGGDRVTLVFTAVLANVVYQLAVYGELPQIPYMTFLDWYNLIYFIHMLIVLLASTLTVFHTEEYFEHHFHFVDSDHLRKADLFLGLLLLLLQICSLIFFACWAYKLVQQQEQKLTMDWYEQQTAGIIKAKKVQFSLKSNERAHHGEKLPDKVKSYRREYRSFEVDRMF